MSKPKTRMQKHTKSNAPASAMAPGAVNVVDYQLEGGDEECQIKRIVMSAASTSGVYFVTFALADEQFTSSSDFTDNRTIYKFVGTGPQIVNETTTIRVERGDHLGILLTQSSVNSGNANAAVSLQLNYLVLS